METKYILLVIAIFTTIVGLSVIFAGCNSEDRYVSIPQKCAEYTDRDQYNSCISKQTTKENTCSDIFWWLRL